jgi:hypothetical protein
MTHSYAHILDEDRKVNAVKMEQAFYAGKANPDLHNIRPPATDEDGALDLELLIEKLRSAPPDTRGSCGSARV